MSRMAKESVKKDKKEEEKEDEEDIYKYFIDFEFNEFTTARGSNV